MIVAVVGDSISAGSPLWDPDPEARGRLGRIDERSQWQYWAAAADPALEFRTSAVYGERTDQIAARLDAVLDGAGALVVQGGINDVVQRRPLEDAVRDLAGMLERGLRAGLPVAIPDVLPWDNGDARAAAEIVRLNGLIHALASRLGVALLPFNETLADPADPARMRPGLSDDGDHPSVEGHRLLGERAFRRF